MSNQVILWGTLIVPWITLFLIPKENIRRYMPAGLFYTLMFVIIQEIGIANGWWVIRETTYPLAVLPTYTYGIMPVLMIWVLHFTFGRIWAYFAVAIFFNAIFTFFVFPWFAGRRIIDYYADGIGFILGAVLIVMGYVFQLWQEGRFAQTSSMPNLQLEAAKPLPNQQDNTDEQ